ncbi:MAG TPA: hypothetical protein VMU80_16445 [Bryobacteraceae bacterium]|nr:hypothetical protein [Bryobacteraceae bacterium]
MPDKFIVGAFWADAESLFETARQAEQAGLPDCDLAILIGPQGGIHMLPAAGWSLTGLLAEHGAQTAYRVTREHGGLRLEGRSGPDTCLLRRASDNDIARELLGGSQAYQAAGSPGPCRAWIPAGAAITAGNQTGEPWTKFA